MTALAQIHADHKLRRARFAAAAVPRAVPAHALPAPVSAPPPEPPKPCASYDVAPTECACEMQPHPDTTDLHAWPSPATIAAAFIGRFQPAAFTPAQPDYRAIALRIINRCASDAGITPMALKSHRRRKCEVAARHKAMWLLRHETPWSLPKIGTYLGDRDHTTIFHGVAVFEAREPGFCAAWRAGNVGKGVVG